MSSGPLGAVARSIIVLGHGGVTDVPSSLAAMGSRAFDVGRARISEARRGGLARGRPRLKHAGTVRDVAWHDEQLAIVASSIDSDASLSSCAGQHTWPSARRTTPYPGAESAPDQIERVDALHWGEDQHVFRGGLMVTSGATGGNPSTRRTQRGHE